MSGFGKCHNAPASRSDASFPLGEVDHAVARRLVFMAEESTAHDERAWDRKCTAELADPTPLPVRKTAWQSRPLAGTEDQHATISDDGHVYRVGDEETAQFASLMETQSGRFQARVEATLQQICRDETGQFETEEETATRIARDQRLREQGSIVCDALEREGIVGYRADAWQLVSFGVHSHEIVEIPAYRRICLNPYVAHRLRIPFLNWLQYFAQDKNPNHIRFWTFTTGKRVPIHRLEARIKWLHRRISELNAEPFMVESGVRIIFRATEFGTLESATRKGKEADESEAGGMLEGGAGGCWYHPHAHCVVWLKHGRLKPWRWEELLRRVWKFWGHHWDEGGSIRDMRECVKYVTKPGQLVWLAENNPKELAKLHEVLFLKKLVQPLDELKTQRRAADKAGLRPVLRWKNDVQRWVLERDPNRNPIADGSKDSGLISAAGTSMTNSAAERYFKRDKHGVGPADVQACRVVARCSPSFNSGGVKEPRVVVMGTYFDKRAVMGHPLVRRMVSATREAYQRGVCERAAAVSGFALLGAADRGLRVHTGTPTVPLFDPGPLLFDPDEAHDPGFLASLAEIGGQN